MVKYSTIPLFLRFIRKSYANVACRTAIYLTVYIFRVLNGNDCTGLSATVIYQFVLLGPTVFMSKLLSLSKRQWGQRRRHYRPRKVCLSTSEFVFSRFANGISNLCFNKNYVVLFFNLSSICSVNAITWVCLLRRRSYSHSHFQKKIGLITSS